MVVLRVLDKFGQQESQKILGFRFPQTAKISQWFGSKQKFII